MSANFRALLLVGLLAGALWQGAESSYDRQRFKEIVYNDDSNDDAIYMTAQELLTRSGYKYEDYYVRADDGYITNLIRIVNPLAERAKLRQPPVLLFHGANVDSSSYLIASSIQHHPEPFPAPPGHLMTSSNRSLGFTLANNGFDVWLVGQRGSNKANSAYISKGIELDGSAEPVPDEIMMRMSKLKSYWSYGLDDIIAYELPAQVNKVRQVTGAPELSILSFSLSTPTTMAYLASHPEVAKSVNTYIQMAPAIAADHFTFIDRIYFEKLCPIFPTRGIGFTPTYFLKPAVRKLIIALSKSRRVRYSTIHQFIRALFGPSHKYMTNLERNFLAHIFQPVSFKSVQHYCQNSVAKKLTKFDYGKARNNELYGSDSPPEYDISRLEVQNYMVVSGTSDALADPTTVDRLVEKLSTRKPKRQVVAAGFNHADIIAAVEVDKYINLPIVDELIKNSLESTTVGASKPTAMSADASRAASTNCVIEEDDED